jgi:hypothetical protein
VTARALALVLLVAGWGVPLAFPHLADDDAACAIVISGEKGQSARLTAALEPRASDHCAICHSLRSFRNARLDSARAATDLAQAGYVQPAAESSRPLPLRYRLPARAPPA